MTEPTPPPVPPASRAYLVYTLLFLLAAGAGAGAAVLLMSIATRKEEARHPILLLAELDEDTIDPEVWGRSFPFQYDTYRRTVDTQRTQYGGSEAFPRDHLEENPRLRVLFAGYAFSEEYREERGHHYMLTDQDVSKRAEGRFKQTGACLHCHASVIPAYRKAGGGDVMKGFEKVCAMPLKEARKLVEHPVACIDCHSPETMRLRVTRPGFLRGIAALARGDAPVPHIPSIERYRYSGLKRDYDPNADATRQEMRSFACGQCHVEYYFKDTPKEGLKKVVTYPWAKGLKADDILAYYDEEGFHDWKHGKTKAPVLKAQHPEFEMWSQGIHARSGVACADCHMPYVRKGAMKLSDHQVRSPMLNINNACQTCHRYPQEEIEARVSAIQGRTKALLERGEKAVVALIEAAERARQQGATDADLAPALKLQREAQWRVDFVNAENSLGFHAPQEAARLLAEGIDLARQGQIAALTAGRK